MSYHDVRCIAANGRADPIVADPEIERIPHGGQQEIGLVGAFLDRAHRHRRGRGRTPIARQALDVHRAEGRHHAMARPEQLRD